MASPQNVTTHTDSPIIKWEDDIASRKAGQGGVPWKRDDENFFPRFPEAHPALENDTTDFMEKRTSTHDLGPWHLSQVSIPEDEAWDVDSGKHEPTKEKYAYYYDDSAGEGQTIYLMEEGITKGYQVSVLTRGYKSIAVPCKDAGQY